MPQYVCMTRRVTNPLRDVVKARSIRAAEEAFREKYDLGPRVKLVSDRIDMLLVERLREYCPTNDPWGCVSDFRLSMVRKVQDEDFVIWRSHEHTNEKPLDPEYHAARIAWLMQNPSSLKDPISVDNHCDFGQVLPIPIILDGWHRFFAHVLLRRKFIAVSYGGRVDLRKYLEGKTETPPTE